MEVWKMTGRRTLKMLVNYTQYDERRLVDRLNCY